MKLPKILIISRRILWMAVLAALILQLGLTLLFIRLTETQTVEFADPLSGIVVIDAGHGGIDGGTCQGGVLEKDVNLAIAIKLKTLLEERGYTVIMTRDEDISLDDLNNSSSSRHKRDLNARVDIINASDAQLFISIHVNSAAGCPSADGSIVYYGTEYTQNLSLAYCVQLALNSLTMDGAHRTTRNPLEGDYYLLNRSDIPGVIVETAFITNSRERQLLTEDEFLSGLASAIADGVTEYLDNEQFRYADPADLR